MKSLRITLLILFLALGFNCIGFAQTNYYNWIDNDLNNLGQTFKPGTQLTSDEFGKIYFVANDGRICYCFWTGSNWENGTLSSPTSSQLAKQHTGLEYRNYSLFFVNEDGDLSRFFYSNNIWSHQVLNSSFPKVMTGTQITTDESGKVYFVSIDGSIYYCDLSGSNWSCSSLSIANPEQKVKQNTGIEYKNYSLFFVNENSDISRFYYSNNSWNHEVLSNSSSFKVLSGTQLTTDEFGKVYFVNAYGFVSEFYQSGGSWNCDWLNGSAVKAQAWTGLYYFDKQIFYTGIDNKTHIFYNNDCNWEYAVLNNNCSSAQYSDYTMSGMTSLYNNLFYINSNDNKLHCLKPAIANTFPFVYLKDKKFMCNNTELKLKVINFIVDINTDDNVNYWVSENISYDNLPSNRNCNDKASCLTQLEQDFLDIKNLGFTAIRLMGGLSIKPSKNTNDLNFYVSGITSDPTYSYTDILLNSDMENKVFSMLLDVLNAAQNADLKVIFCTGNGGNTTTLFHYKFCKYLERLSTNFKDNSSLMAYDLYNEPANMSLSKNEICSSVNNWYYKIKNNDPNHLITIGLQTATDVFSWDPAILSVDFLSFHLYPLPDSEDANAILDPRSRVFSDIKWISNISEKFNKPWIIGETGFASDLDSSPYTNTDWGTETDQENYAKATMERAQNCGGSGYSWWQYHDVYWGNPTQDYLGLYNHDDIAKKIVTNQTFKNYNSINTCDCPQPTNYYNYFNYSQYSYSGIVKDENNNEITDAVIYGWGKNWNGVAMTYSKSDGSFTLYSNIPLYCIKVTAIKKNIVSVGEVNNSDPLTAYQGLFSLSDLSCQNFSVLNYLNEELNIFPNPANEWFFILSENNINNLKIIDIFGHTVLSSNNINDKEISINCSNIAAGLYLVVVETESGQITKRIQIIH